MTVYQFDELIDLYEFSLAALHSERSMYGSIAHKSEATRAWDGPHIATNWQHARYSDERGKLSKLCSHLYPRCSNYFANNLF